MKIFAYATAALCLIEATSAEKLRRKAIAGGSAAGNGEAEYFALFSNGKCGGTLIDESHVLTSAWCIESGAPAMVYVGATDRSFDTGTAKEVECGYIHPDFKTGCGGTEPENDIAILRLKTPCDGCETVPLNTGANDVAVGDTVTQYGLGRTSQGGDYPDKIRKTSTLEAISDADCRAVWGDELPEDDTMYFCANKDQAVGYCEGDFGGPGIVVDGGTDVQVGVMVMIGDEGKCGDPAIPDVFTDVATYETWINEVIASDECNVDVEGCSSLVRQYAKSTQAWVSKTYHNLFN